MIQTIISLCVTLFLFLSLTVLLLLLFAAFTIAPKYEKHFSDVEIGLFDSLFPTLVGRFFSRPSAYMINMILSDPNNRKGMSKLFFHDYDFRVQAQKWEIIYSWIFFCFFSSLMFFMSVFAVLYYGGRLFGLDLTISLL